VTSADPCTGARKAGHRSGADSPRGIDHGQFDGARVPPRWSGPQGAIGRSRRIGSVLEGYAALGRRPRVTLRFATLHFARPAAGIQEPHERGTGGGAGLPAPGFRPPLGKVCACQSPGAPRRRKRQLWFCLLALIPAPLIEAVAFRMVPAAWQSCGAGLRSRALTLMPAAHCSLSPCSLSS